MTRKHEIMDEFDKTIGTNIRNCRISRNLSMNDLANAIGVSPQQVHKYEMGSNRLSIGRFILISRFLKKNISFFIKG